MTEAQDRGPGRWWTALVVATTLAVIAACGALLWTLVPPTADFAYLVLAMWALLGFAAIWLVLAVFGCFRYRRFRLSAVAPLVILVTVILAVADVPSRVGFAVSRPALEAAADRCDESLDETKIGVYEVWRIESADGGCRFFMKGGLVDSVGLAYLPDGPPTERSGDEREITYRGFEDEWYRFVQQF
ncbi:hypothetical protein V1Y59_12910 [Gordonia sp. PKS22-38]|uniref:Uncharacterized protein n=1 Tax=Gordonia prachuapensis TaxID=3115651 RepID=A0ABU7MUI0_9ACTN|nr:hypothetical protein [Gordonia sp. PKS22-38]